MNVFYPYIYNLCKNLHFIEKETTDQKAEVTYLMSPRIYT